jgi:glycosyltransferase involved in cell wall biosynthesis
MLQEHISNQLPTRSTPAIFKIIVNCGPCQGYIGKSLASLKAQTQTQWEAYITIDPCDDRTFEEALETKAGDERINITRNEERLYSMANLVRAIKRSCARPEDIIVVLDGDDWFHTTHALQIIADTYAQYDCWMTYGSWVSNVAHIPGGLPAYEAGTTDFRQAEWLATAVRTWKKWLWDLIDDKDLRDEEGEYFNVVEDLAVMFPMLEMSGTNRARHIPDLLMLYNRANPACVGNIRRAEMERVAQYLRSKPPYKPLSAKPSSTRKLMQAQKV